MSMTRKKLSLSLIIFVVIVSIAAFPGLPQQLVIQINAAGAPSNSTVKWIGAWVLPLVMIVIHFTRKDASRGVPEANRRDWSLITLAVQLILALAQFSLLLYNYGHSLMLKDLLPFTAGVLLILVGNYAFRTRPNVTFGIRNKWTLSDPSVWKSTHRFAGITFMLTGAILIAMPFIQPDSSQTFPIILVLAGVNYVASYIFYRKQVHV